MKILAHSAFTLLQDVLCIPLQFEMSSGDSIERTERANGFIGETRNSQYNGLSEDCIKPGSGASEYGESVSNSTFLRNGEEHLVKRLCGMSQREYQSQSWFRWLTTLFTRQAVTYRRLIREIDHINGLCLTFAHLRLQCGETVTVEKEIL